MKTPRQCSEDQGGRPAFSIASRTATVDFYLRRPPEEVELEAWEGRVVTCVRPKTWVEEIASGCEVTLSAALDFWNERRVPGPGLFPRDSRT